MRNAILLHGTCGKEEYYSMDYPSASNSHWIPWLQKQLLMKDVYAITPEMFQSFDPDYTVRKREFEKNDITEETLLVGHSCGGGFLIRWLSENSNRSVWKVILVAPRLDPNGIKWNDFFDFIVDPLLASRTQWVVVFSSSNDSDDIKSSISIIKKLVSDISITEFTKYGHFTETDLWTVKFPELLKECLRE